MAISEIKNVPDSSTFGYDSASHNVNFKVNGSSVAEASNVTTTFLILKGTEIQPADPTPTGSTNAYMMMGLGADTNHPVIFTPAGTAISFTIDGESVCSNASSGINMRFRWGTGTPSSNGAAEIGTLVVGPPVDIANGGLVIQSGIPFAKTRLITGLTPGTQIWIDCAVEVITSGTAGPVGVSIFILDSNVWSRLVTITNGIITSIV
jgi:hypothetical protein